MATSDYAGIRQELSDIRKENALSKRNPIFDFGAFILIFFFFLVAVSTILLIFGITINMYTFIIAVIPTWLIIALFRHAPFYSLIIAVIAILFLVIAALLLTQVYDLLWDSNAYHKPNAGLLSSGWNPFESSLEDYSNSTGLLPYNTEWQVKQADSRTKASFIIGACFYSFSEIFDYINLNFSGALSFLNNLAASIEFGKIFNIASMVACICIVAPLVKDVLNIKGITAFAIALFTALNPVTLIQTFSYYNDAFLYQLITIVAVSFAYLAVKNNGRYSNMSKLIGFLAVCLAINVKASAIIYCAIICLFYYISYLINAEKFYPDSIERKRKGLAKFFYFVSMVIVAVLIVGSITFAVNQIRYGSFLYGIVGEDSVNNMLAGEVSLEISELPKFVQVLISLFSVGSSDQFLEINLKIPFTYTLSEWDASYDTLVGGWGIFFSGIFVISLAVIIVTLRRLYKEKSKQFTLLLVSTLLVLLPIFIVPYVWWARFYGQMFWIPFIALCCLFAPVNKQKVKKSSLVLRRILGALMCVLLIVNLGPQAIQLKSQIEETKEINETLSYLETMSEWYSLDVTLANDDFYGYLYNLEEAGFTDYTYKSEGIDEVDGELFNYMTYDLIWKDDSSETDSYEFSSSLKNSGYLIIFAACGETTFNLDEELLANYKALGLEYEVEDIYQSSYIAVISPDGEVLYEAQSEDKLEYETVIDDISVAVTSSGGLNEYMEATITINGINFAVGQGGTNIVVYDTVNNTLVDSVRIDSYYDSSLYR